MELPSAAAFFRAAGELDRAFPGAGCDWWYCGWGWPWKNSKSEAAPERTGKFLTRLKMEFGAELVGCWCETLGELPECFGFDGLFLVESVLSRGSSRPSTNMGMCRTSGEGSPLPSCSGPTPLVWLALIWMDDNTAAINDE